MATIQPIDELMYGIWHNKMWVMGPNGYTPIQHEKENVLKPLMDFFQNASTAGDHLETAFDPGSKEHMLYQLLAWKSTVAQNGSFIDQDPHWLFSCDPVFHLHLNPEIRNCQITEYGGIYEWLVSLNVPIVELPPLHPVSEEEWSMAEQDPELRLPLETTTALFDRWNALTISQKAAAHHLYEHFGEEIMPSLCAIMLFLTGRMNAAKLARIYLAASGVSPDDETHKDARSVIAIDANLTRKLSTEI